MARSCIFFLVLILLGNARGGRVLSEQSAQNEKALQAPRSLSPEQQASSVSSGVQSFEVGGTNDDGSSNRRRSLVRLIPNTHGASSSSDKLSSVVQNDASGPVSAPASGSWAGEVNAQGFPKPSLSSQAQNEQTTQADEHLNCAHPRRQTPSYRVRVPFKPQSPTKTNPSGYADGFASTRISSETSPQTLPTQYGPPLQVPASNLVAPSQSSPVPAEQGGYGFQSRWSASQGQNFPSVSQPSQYSPGLQAQSSSRPVAQPSWGLANLYTSSQTHGESDLASQAQFGYRSQSSGISISRDVGSSSLFTSAQSQDVQSSQLEALNQSPGVQTQSLYNPAFPSQGVASLYTSPLQSQAGSDSLGVQWQWVSSDGLMALQRGSLGSLYNPVASIRFQSGTFGGVPQSQSALTQGGVPPPAIQSNSRSFTSSQNAASTLSSVAQSSMTDRTALQRQNLAVPQPIPQTQTSNLLGTSQNLATPPMPSQQDGFNAQSSWSASQGQSVSATQPMRQTQASNLVAPPQSLPSSSLSSQQEGYGLQASWYAIQGQSNPLATVPKLQTPVSSILGPSQSAPVPAEQGGYGFQSTWSASQDQNFQSVSQPSQYSPGLQTQSSSRPVAQLPSLYSSPLQSQAGYDSLGVQWQLVSSDGLMALQRGSLGSLYNPAASIRFQSGTFGVVPQSQSALTQGGVQPPAIQSNSRSFTSSQNAASPLASVASSQKNPSAAWTASNMHLYGG